MTYWCYAARTGDGEAFLGMLYSSQAEALSECNDRLKGCRGGNASVAVFPFLDNVADRDKPCRYFNSTGRDRFKFGMSDAYANWQECYMALRKWIEGIERFEVIQGVGMDNMPE